MIICSCTCKARVQNSIKKKPNCAESPSIATNISLQKGHFNNQNTKNISQAQSFKLIESQENLLPPTSFSPFLLGMKALPGH
jgi:hypothetical protein